MFESHSFCCPQNLHHSADDKVDVDKNDDVFDWSENPVGTGEYAGCNQHFLLLPQSFQNSRLCPQGHSRLNLIDIW